MNSALAVGKERMGQDALDLVQLLGSIQGKKKILCGPLVMHHHSGFYQKTLPMPMIRNRNISCIVGAECAASSVKISYLTFLASCHHC